MNTNQKKRKKPHNKGRKNISAVKKARRAVANFVKRHQMVAAIVMACLMLTIVVAAIMIGNIPGAARPGSNTPEATNTFPADTSASHSPPEATRAPVPDFVDLTALSSTMVYAEVYNILVYPEDYIDKTIKMRGYYSPTLNYYGQPDLYYHFVVIEDATECCRQGLEFIWDGEHAYPDDYPAENTLIEVVGIFGRYEDEFGDVHYYVAVDDITISNNY